MTSDEDAPPGVDAAVASPARVYDYMLGGKDNYAADRAVAERMLHAEPRASRCAYGRSAPAPSGIWPRTPACASSSTSAQGCPPRTTSTRWPAATPRTRVVYVDNDPMVAVHARALMEHSAPDVGVVHADLRRPGDILADPHVRPMLDSGEPVVLLLVAVLHVVPDG